LDGDLRLLCALAQSELPISKVDVQKTQKAKQDQNCISKLKPFFNIDSEIRNVIRGPPEQAEPRAKMKAPLSVILRLTFNIIYKILGVKESCLIEQTLEKKSTKPSFLRRKGLEHFGFIRPSSRLQMCYSICPAGHIRENAAMIPDKESALWRGFSYPMPERTKLRCVACMLGDDDGTGICLCI
jgi:hypothetical protein